MEATFKTYDDPKLPESAGWAGVIKLPKWCIFIPSDGGEPHVAERDPGEEG